MGGAEWKTVSTPMDLRYVMASGPIAEQDGFSELTVQCLRPESPAFFSHTGTL